jgi:DNA-binding winged helix-turn-helix (wHTH) protein/tetratricopeptide (TPR) repeat protein
MRLNAARRLQAIIKTEINKISRMPDRTVYSFGPYRLDLALSRLERDGAAVPLPPKAFDLLVLLARNTDRVLSKEELIKTLWPDSFVEDANLTQHVYTLRKALGDQADGCPYIDTVPRRGYRLVVRDFSAAEPAAPRVDADERRFVAVLHCAVVDAAAIVERLGSSAMHDVMREIVAYSERAVAEFEGVLGERHADGFIALFGVDAAHEDDGRRAVVAALAIERRASQLGFSLRMGVSSGPLVVTRIGGNDRSGYSVVGEALRGADLLQQFAAPGGILIDEAICRAIDRHISAEEAAPAPPGTRAFRVTGVHGASGSVWPQRRTLVPFVGRDHETAILRRLGDQALAGHGQAVSIVGEPGMGKSRLAYEFTHALSRSGREFDAIEGRCVSYGSRVPYLPLVDLIRARCGINDADPPDVIRDAVVRTVSGYALPPDSASPLLRLLGVMDDSANAPSPELVKARTFDALRRLLLRPTAQRPLVIVVEDLHWIDRTSEEFLATLVERLAGARVIVLATHRPGYGAPWLDRSYVTQISLAPLDPVASARLVESIALPESAGTDVSSAILRRGEGNPFFLEELARAVSERGGSHGIPETVQAAIMARLDRLPQGAKHVLQSAAVLGREVPVRELARIPGAVDLDANLRELRRQDFVYERMDGDEAVLVFKHALTQDVAYDSLLSRRRRELHLEAARMLEDLYRDRLDEITERLAHHYARTDVLREAAIWLVRAADRAARVYANAEAILHLELAARRVQRMSEADDRDRLMIDVALRHAQSLYFLGRFRESVAVLVPHEARVSRLDDDAVSGAYAFWLAHMYSRLGDRQRATASAQRAIEAATAAGDRRTLGKAHGLLALEGHWAGDAPDGIAHGREAVRLLTSFPGERWWLGMAHFYLAINHLIAADYDTAVAEAAHAEACGREIGDPRLAAYAAYATGWIEATRGNTTAAIAACRASLERAPDRVSRAYASLFLAFALLKSGEHAEARERLELTLAELETFSFPQWHGLAAVLMAEAERQAGRFESAARWISTGVEIARVGQYTYALDLAQNVSERIPADRRPI